MKKEKEHDDDNDNPKTTHDGRSTLRGSEPARLPSKQINSSGKRALRPKGEELAGSVLQIQNFLGEDD